MNKQETTAVEPQTEEVLSGIESLNDLALELLTPEPEPAKEPQEPEKPRKKESAQVEPVDGAEAEQEDTEPSVTPESEQEAADPEAKESTEDLLDLDLDLGLDPESESESESVEPDDNEPKKASSFDKRIDKLTTQNNDLKDEITESKSRLADLESKIEKADKKVSVKPESEGTDLDSLVNGVNSLQDLDDLAEEAISELKWARRMKLKLRREPDVAEAEVRKRYGSDDIDVETLLEELVVNSEEVSDFIIPKVRKRLEETAHWVSEAHQTYPWLQDSTHLATTLVEQSLKDYGDIKLKDIPNAKLTLARAVMGYHYEQQAAAAAKKPKPKAPNAEPTPQPGPASAPPVQRAPSRSNKADQAANAVYGGGGKDAFTDFVKAALLPD